MAEEQKGERRHSEESVKLFVGQVPKHMTEAQLLAMFKEFTLVDEVNIIKDKVTKASRGFIIFHLSEILCVIAVFSFTTVCVGDLIEGF